MNNRLMGNDRATSGYKDVGSALERESREKAFLSPLQQGQAWLAHV